jgi:hypothetical protein
MLMLPNFDHPKLSITIERTVLADLLAHAVAAAHLAGHLDDDAHVHLVSALAEHVDAVVHELSELLGASRATAARDAVAPNESVAHDGVPMLTAAAGGIP